LNTECVYYTSMSRLLRDKLSAFMESKGAASPGMLALTSYLSKVNPDLIVSDYMYIHSY